MSEKETKYKTTPNYPNSSSKPRMEILRDDVAMSKPTFEMKDIEDKEARKKADEYASELKRETRGKKAGGTIRSASSRADGIATKGKTRGKIC
jgi:hypothetical protein